VAAHFEEALVRRKNPPQEYLDKAEDLEKFLRPITIASIYALFAVLYAMVVAVVFTVLVHSLILSATPSATTFFVLVGSVPMAFAVLTLFIAPHDPLSSYIARLAKSWRRPLDVHPDELVFRELLMDGDALCFKIGVYYPWPNQTQDIKERLYTYVNGALAKDCAMRDVIPTNNEVEDVINGPLELLASEHGIPILYAEIRDICRLRGAYDVNTNNLTSVEPWRTGTYH
jgi:hypothetical protein